MSVAKFDTWQNSDGTENYKCRAWVNFNGTGTVAIRASGNVSSITDNGTGDYTVNFTNAMPDADYVFTGSAGTVIETHTANGSIAELSDTPRTTSLIRIETSYVNSTVNSTDFDYDQIGVAIFR